MKKFKMHGLFLMQVEFELNAFNLILSKEVFNKHVITLLETHAFFNVREFLGWV